MIHYSIEMGPRDKIKVVIKKRQPSPSSTALTAIDLFCGCGGLTTGLVKSGINVLAGVDVWDKSVETYKSNHPHLGLCKDLTKYSPSEFSKDTSITEFDLLTGGPPCQGFSIAGKRDRNDPRNSLFMEYVKYLYHFNPKAFIMENVMGILSMKMADGEKAIDIITTELERGYNIRINKLYASDFGVPQNRRRVVIIGYRKDLGIYPTEPQPIAGGRPAVKTVLEPRASVPSKQYLSQRAIDGIKRKRERSKREGKGFGAQFLDPDKPSYTIPARYWKDGYDALVKYDDDHIRRLTINELKQIQSFPLSYDIKGSKKDVIMQIGNAVAVEFAHHLGKHVQRELQGDKTKISPK